MTLPLPDGWRSWSPAQRERLLRALRDAQAAPPRWRDVAHPHQLPPPGEWFLWLLLAGRGAGKTRAGAEWAHEQTEHVPRLALVGRTAADVRDVMVEGESGLLATARPGRRPKYEPSKRRVTWPNGAQAACYSADEPDLLRGPQHGGAWCDEVASWARGPEAWSNLEFGLRLGDDPRILATTTPRSTPFVRTLLKDATTAVVRASTYTNLANLAPTFRRQVLARYEGTRLGRQELYAEVLDDVDGALWTWAMVEAARMPGPITGGALERIVVAVDPAVTSGEESDETGIVVAGIDRDGVVYLLEDLSVRDTPQRWARVVVDAYERHRADRVVAETNQGGDLVESLLRAQAGDRLSYQRVTATRGKRLRAEPVAALYEQGRVRHAPGLDRLEEQLTTWTPADKTSPDRLDAAVWAVTALALTEQPRRLRYRGAA